MAESLVLLAVAVVLFRGFAAEGYMISTGSMAPTLLGYHHQIHCPECSFHFARGARITDDEEGERTLRADFDPALPSLNFSRCPNCGYHGIVTDNLPRTEGDQLLVHKHAYEYRDPRRWEVIVFRNPGDARQAYVKRVVGLPGEQIELKDGEAFINGKLTRKPYEVQRGMHILLSDYAAQPATNDHDTQPVWVKLSSESAWSLEEDHLQLEGASQPAGSEIAWVGYRHWISTGGAHVTEVPLERWPARLAPLDANSEPLQYHNQTLSCRGVFTDVERRTWLSRSDDRAFQEAINTLAQRSHIAPILDDYGYNNGELFGENSVREFFVSMTLSEISGDGRYEIELSDGEQIFTAVFKFAAGTVDVLRNGDAVPVRTAHLSDALTRQPVQIDFSLIDQQMVLAVNGREIVEPFAYERDSHAVDMRRPIRFGAAGLNAVVKDLRLYRDVYYTRKDANDPGRYVMGKGKYFVLGDNSPVSVDSRYWDDPAVPKSALIGKPIVVHLPSQSKRIQWGSQERHVRVPDFSRVRLVR